VPCEKQNKLRDGRMFERYTNTAGYYHIVIDAKVVDHGEERGNGEHAVEHLTFEVCSHKLLTDGFRKAHDWAVERFAA
jgi:hypothetical protein